MKMVSRQTFGPLSISQSTLYSPWMVKTWAGRITRERTKPLALKTSPVAWPWQWACLPKEWDLAEKRRQAKQLQWFCVLSCPSMFLSWETSCFRRKKTAMPPFSCTCCVKTHKVPSSPLFFSKYVEFQEDGTAVAPSWGIKNKLDPNRQILKGWFIVSLENLSTQYVTGRFAWIYRMAPASWTTQLTLGCGTPLLVTVVLQKSEGILSFLFLDVYWGFKAASREFLMSDNFDLLRPFSTLGPPTPFIVNIFTGSKKIHRSLTPFGTLFGRLGSYRRSH